MQIAIRPTLALLAFATIPLSAQSPSRVLTLDDAVTLALRNNLDHIRARNVRDQSGVALRGAYGQLLPNVSSSFGVSFREGRQDLVQGVAFGATSDVVSSSYSIGVGLQLSMGNWINTRRARAEVAASEEAVRASENTVRNLVTQAYFTALQAEAQALLQDTIVASAAEQLRLTRARYDLLQSRLVEVRSSEAALGRVQIQRVRQQAAARRALRDLFDVIGAPMPDSLRLEPVSGVTEPTFALANLIDEARRTHPQLESLRAREAAANHQVAQARSSWLPTLSLNTSFNGNTSQQTNPDGLVNSARAQRLAARASCFTNDSLRQGAGLSPITTQCDAINFTDADADAIRRSNDVFPFAFNRSPLVYSAGLSFPIFNGFVRENNVANASLARIEAQHARRQEELRLISRVSNAYDDVMIQYQAVQLLEQLRESARQALELAQEGYRIGTATYLELSSARRDFEQASAELVTGIFDYHRRLATLELEVGRRLR